MTPRIALALLLALSASGCAFFTQMRDDQAAAMAAGSTGCDPGATRISNYTSAGNANTWMQQCGDKKFRCTQVTDSKGNTTSIECAPAE